MFNIWRRLQKYFFVHVVIVFSIFIYLIREFFFGFENANNFLKNLSQPAIIPILRLRGAKIGDRCNIQSGLVFHNCRNYSNLTVGANCHIGKNCFFDLRDRITIGDNVVIAMQSTFITHLDMSNSPLSFQFPSAQGPVQIGDNSYVGSNSNILMGVGVGDSGFIAANSLVRNDVPSFTMVGGVPAKIIKKIDGI